MIDMSFKLRPKEQQTLSEFVQGLSERFGDQLQAIWLFGSKARGDSTPTSDIDVLVVIDNDDWRLHKQIRYFAVDLNLKYDLDLSPRIWTTSYLQEVAALGTHFYRAIQREHIDLLRSIPQM